jgi:ATP-dependent helicase/nuclease subunit A
LNHGETASAIARVAALDSAFEAATLRRACSILASGKKTDQDRGAILSVFLSQSDRTPEQFYAYCEAYLTATGTIRASLMTKDIATAHPDIAAALQDEAERVHRTRARMRSAEIAECTAALLRLGTALLDRYEKRKADRGLVDYGDLIAHTVELLQRPGVAPWVLFKLDGGIDHILIDEAQDTSPDQWAIVRALADEFFVGVGQRDTPRTIFAVGDVKQSIYSFQGADPAAFQSMRDIFAERVAAVGGRWRPVDLDVSFRSTAAVLGAIDAIFAQTESRDGVAFDERAIQHIVQRIGDAGLVELWPAVSPREAEGPTPWKPPVERIRADSAQTRLAYLIARRIQRMVATREMLPSKGRPIRPGDVMVLVRHRTGFVDDLVRALKELNIAVAGVDRMHLTQQMAVMDLMALGHVALLPEDDLTLATVLKGPLIDLSEDQLFTLAYGRGGSLWDALRSRAQTDEIFARALESLSHVLARADLLAPYEFYNEILGGRLRGREKLLARLGPDAADPLGEFVNLALAYESSHVPTLEGFLHWIEIGDVEIKRDLDQGAQNAVRVITVHGAKGLEAPIVFLPDTFQTPRTDERFFWPNVENVETFLWAPKRALHDARCDAERERIKALREQEYRRLLYVALTRARDRLYICGWRTKTAAPEGCWYNLIERGLKTLTEPVEDAFLAGEKETDETTLLRLESPQTAMIAQQDAAPDIRVAPLPDWAHRTAPAEETPPRPLAPSRPDGSEPPVVSPLGEDAGVRFRRGRIVHSLLQTLPDLAPPARADAARRFVARPAHDLTTDEQAAIVAETLAVLDTPDSAFLFGPGSRAEVPLVGRVGEAVISAQLDRILVQDDSVSVVDFKTNRPPPARAEDVPAIYLRQMAIYRAALALVYPGKRVDCYLLWTDGARLMPLPAELLALRHLDATPPPT